MASAGSNPRESSETGLGENVCGESPGPSGLSPDMPQVPRNKNLGQADGASRTLSASQTWLHLVSAFALTLNLQLIYSFLHSSAAQSHCVPSVAASLGTSGCKAGSRLIFHPSLLSVNSNSLWQGHGTLTLILQLLESCISLPVLSIFPP